MHWPSRRQSFWLLMAASAAAMWLPWTGSVRSLSDPILAPLSSWLYQGGHAVRRQAAQWASRSGRADDERIAQLQAERDGLVLDVVGLRQQNQDLSQRLREATGLRAELLGLRGRLVPARVLARDAVAWREAALLDIGRSAQIQRKQWVSGSVRAFLDRGADSGVAPAHWVALSGASVLAQETYRRSVLVGQIERVDQVTARVKLLTDWDSQVAGQIVGANGELRVHSCSVKGQGPGRLIVEGVAPPRPQAGDRDSDQPPAAEGDLILSAPNTANLPGQLLIGVVQSVRRSDRRPLEYELQAEPAIPYARLTDLFVIDPVGPPQEGGPR